MNKRINPLNINYTNEMAWGGALKGGLSQGASMAATGMAFGPVGAAIGGGLGLIMGGIQGHKAQEQEEELMAQQEANQQKLAQSNYDAGLGSKRIAAYNDSVNSPVNPLEQDYAMGGIMGADAGYGSITNNDVNHFATGGTHEENPNGGIPQGMGDNGLPNTVEEDEVSVKLSPDTKYIFSDRLIFQ